MAGYRGDGYGDHGEDHRFGRGEERLADDPRAVRAAEEWRQRFGREGHEGSWGLHDESYERVRRRHIEELDRDYDEWCREREQQFGREFDSWRQQRSAGAGAQDDGGRSGGELIGDAGSASAVATPAGGNVTSSVPTGRRRKSAEGSGA